MHYTISSDYATIAFPETREAVIYNPVSGDSLTINLQGHRIVELLTAHNGDVAGTITELHECFPAKPLDEVESSVNRFLETLESRGIVRRVE